jgi:GT2 family glycosyltransferase
MIPSVSVVIPTYDRRPRLEGVLGALAEQTFDREFEVVVVSDGSTDSTDEYLASGSTPLPVVAVTQSNQGPAVARNHGVDVASGDLIVFVDDDVVPAPGLLAAHVAAHERLGDGFVVIGPMLNPPDHEMSPWIRWEQAMLAKQYRAMQRGRYPATARQFYTGNASLRRCHLLAAGGFDPAFRRAEDVELAYRLDDAGMRWAFEPGAVGLHYAERSYESWWATGYTYGRNDVVFARDRGRAKLLDRIGREYRHRNPATRAITRLCVPRPEWAARVSTSLRHVAGLGETAKLEVVSRQAMSGIYNLAYYRGVADELGAPRELWALVGSRKRR